MSGASSPPQSNFTFLSITVHQGPHFSPGSVLAWGEDLLGQLGNGTIARGGIDAPNPVALPAGTVATAVSAGDNFGLALTTTGHVYAWGANNGGQLGVGISGRTLHFSATPVEVCAVGGCANGPLSGIVAVSAGGSYALALTSTGQALGLGLRQPGPGGQRQP